MVTSSNFESANQKAKALQTSLPQAVQASYDARRKRIVVRLNTRIELSFSPQDTQGLEHATSEELHTIEISPSGFGLHFPKLDADVYLPALLEGVLGSRQWMAGKLGSLGGASRSVAKKAAAMENGRKGGRPKKFAATSRSRPSKAAAK